MNRINQMIDMYATTAADCFHRALLLGHDGSIEEAADFTDKMLDARGQLKTWIKISQAVRGWQL